MTHSTPSARGGRSEPRRLVILAALTLGLGMRGATCGETSWKELIRKDHPRLFFNRDTWPAVKARALGEEHALFLAIKSRVDHLASQELATQDYGVEAAEAAFVFLVTAEPKYRDLARKLLVVSVDYYDRCHAEQQSVNWYSFSRINAWAAYDWLFDHLAEADRKELGASFLHAVQKMQPTSSRKPFYRENWGGTDSGFYSTPSLLWYGGLATYREGIDDETAESFLARGYDLYTELLAFRQRAAGDDGGSASGALNYALAAYPWAEFNFFHTFESATGYNIARDWPYVALLPAYIFWNWLPDDHEFGYGDTYHERNRMPVASLNIHLTQILHFYGGNQPKSAALARWFLGKTPPEQRSAFPFARFLLTRQPSGPPAEDPARRMPPARHFEHMGQVFLRSGSGPEDTYALFIAGGVVESHKQFDHNSFVIYKRGHQALDTGTRPEPGQHLSHYYCRTVAHNAILIHMPGERMPRYWGNPAPEEEPLPVPNDGGQRELLGSRVVAFETFPEYTYVAGDATATYHPDKCRLALRQFVFLPPNHFVIFDRVTSSRPEYRKTWLLHTAGEPEIVGTQFSAAHEQGELVCRTLLPERVEIARIGGPGKQFWSDGRNWPLPKGYRTPDTHPLLGQWRIEVSPSQPREADYFLHLIEVGNRSQGHTTRSNLVRRASRMGVRVQSGENDWELLFSTEGVAGGHLRLERDGRVRIDRELTTEVTPQAGVYGADTNDKP